MLIQVSQNWREVVGQSAMTIQIQQEFLVRGNTTVRKASNYCVSPYFQNLRGVSKLSLQAPLNLVVVESSSSPSMFPPSAGATALTAKVCIPKHLF